MTNYNLYGGAITIQLPSGLLDASTFRQIPDTQEVFIHSTDSKDKDESIIVELMEMVEPKNDAILALKTHIDEISEIDEVKLDLSTLQVTQVENETLKTVAYITQLSKPSYKWSKERSLNKDDQSIIVQLISLIRIQSVETDILVTINIPQVEDLTQDTRINQWSNIIQEASKSVKIEDYGLFGV